jgi:hypothetical protein
MATSRKQQEKRTNPKSMLGSDVTGRHPISEEHIRFHAYMLFQDRLRHGRSGDALADWLQAERELRMGRADTNPVSTARSRSS